MKKLIFIFVAALVFVACSGNGNDKGNKNDNFALDSISDSTTIKVGNQSVVAQAEVVFPDDVEPIKNDLTELVKQLGQGDEFNGYPDSVKIDTADMKSLVNYLVNSKAEWLKNEFADEEAKEDDIPLAYEFKVFVQEETEKYITMAVKESILFGGPRPRFTEYGITYLKPEGKKVETAVLNSDKTEEIKAELLEKVKSYIGGLIKDEDFGVDEVLYLNNDDDENDDQFDLPFNGFYLLGDSIVFPYQVEELAPFTFGKPEVKLSIKDMKEKGWLGNDISDILE